MALKINMQTENWPAIKALLHDFADHSKVCDVCSPNTGAYCATGEQILIELSGFSEVEEVPEDWKPKEE